MRLTKRNNGIGIFGALCLGLVVLAFCRPSPPKLIIPLADGSSFVLMGTDSGRRFAYGGARWQNLLCKALGRQLPAFIHPQPLIWTSFYTNGGIALCFRREEPARHSLQTPWNATGQLYFLDDSGMEHWVPNHGVNFATEKRGQVWVVVEENMYWELPMLHDPELRLRIRETNGSTGSVSTHNFRLKTPVL
jgi:hypothetical protein